MKNPCGNLIFIVAYAGWCLIFKNFIIDILFAAAAIAVIEFLSRKKGLKIKSTGIINLVIQYIAIFMIASGNSRLNTLLGCAVMLIMHFLDVNFSKRVQSCMSNTQTNLPKQKVNNPSQQATKVKQPPKAVATNIQEQPKTNTYEDIKPE